MHKEHPGAGIAHHGADFLAVGRRIAVDVAFAAARLGIPFRTAVEASAGIVEQSGAFGAEIAAAGSVVSPAVDGYHLCYCLLLAFYACHSASQNSVKASGRSDFTEGAI